MADNPENTPPQNDSAGAAGPGSEHLNIKVTDNNNEVFFKIKRSTKLEKLMSAFCERQGKTLSSVRFLFEGQRVQPQDTPDTVSFFSLSAPPSGSADARQTFRAAPTKWSADMSRFQLEMADGDTLEVHQEQVGGSA